MKIHTEGELLVLSCPPRQNETWFVMSDRNFVARQSTVERVPTKKRPMCSLIAVGAERCRCQEAVSVETLIVPTMNVATRAESARQTTCCTFCPLWDTSFLEKTVLVAPSLIEQTTPATKGSVASAPIIAYITCPLTLQWRCWYCPVKEPLAIAAWHRRVAWGTMSSRRKVQLHVTPRLVTHDWHCGRCLPTV